MSQHLCLQHNCYTAIIVSPSVSMQPMHNYVLAGLASGLFAPLIEFHLVVTLISKRDGLVTIEGIRRTNKNLERDLSMQRT
jgi:uncharacterized membrane protein YkvI